MMPHLCHRINWVLAKVATQTFPRYCLSYLKISQLTEVMNKSLIRCAIKPSSGIIIENVSFKKVLKDGKVPRYLKPEQRPKGLGRSAA